MLRNLPPPPPDSSEGLENKYEIVTKEFNKDPQKIKKFVESQMLSYGGPKGALEKLKTANMSKTPAFFRRFLYKFLGNAMPDIQKMGIDSETVGVFNSLIARASYGTKRLRQGGRRRGKTFRKKQQFEGGGGALLRLIIFLATICYMASGFMLAEGQNQELRKLDNDREVKKLKQFTNDDNIFTMKFENEKYGNIGTINFKNGDYYVGSIQDLKPQGYGQLVKDGNTYKGIFDQQYGKGKGTIETPEYLYIGEFNNFEPSGFGKKTMKDSGKEIVGFFLNGRNPIFGSVKDGNKVTLGKINIDNNILIEKNFQSAYELNARNKVRDAENVIKKIEQNMRSINSEVEKAKKIKQDFEEHAGQSKSVSTDDITISMEPPIVNEEKGDSAKISNEEIGIQGNSTQTNDGNSTQSNDGNSTQTNDERQKEEFTERIPGMRNAAMISMCILIIIYFGTKRYGNHMPLQDLIYQQDPQASLNPPTKTNPDYLAIVLVSCKTLFFGTKIIKDNNPYSYENFLEDVKQEPGNRIHAVLRLLSNCKTENNESLFQKHKFLSQLTEQMSDEKIMYDFLNELSLQKKGGARQILKKKANATKKIKPRS
jgi:hypothetical protein